jgi:Lon protease-like protein
MDEEVIEIPSVVPVFPLPEVVLFPRAVLPLHIHEPRYLRMTADALGGARVMAVALLKPGFEPYYFSTCAPIHPVLGIGQIIASEQLDDGNYNILLRGVGRARIREEVPHKPYRLVRIAALEPAGSLPPARVRKLRRELRQTLESECTGEDDSRAHWLRLFETRLPLGDLADLVASGLSIDAELRQDLLAEADPAARVNKLIEHIRVLAAVARARRTQSPAAEWNAN